MHTTVAESQIRSLKMLNAHLATRTFVVSDRITLADIMLATALQRAFSVTFDEPLRKELPNIVRFFETVVNHPKMKSIFGSTEYIEKALQFVPPKKEEKPKVEKPKEEKKEKKAAPKPKDDDDVDDQIAEEPKPKHPLDLLPKATSGFVLDDWKRSYANSEVRGPGGSLQWFYEQCVISGSVTASLH